MSDLLKKNTKILFIHHGAGWGGAPISMMNLIMKLDKSKLDLEVLLLKDSIVKQRLRDKHIKVSVCDSKFYSDFYTYLSHSDAGLIKPYRVYRLLKIFIFWFLSKYIFAPLVLKKYNFDIVLENSSHTVKWYLDGNT